jgi:hypothetical protein
MTYRTALLAFVALTLGACSAASSEAPTSAEAALGSATGLALVGAGDDADLTLSAR